MLQGVLGYRDTDQYLNIPDRSAVFSHIDDKKEGLAILLEVGSLTFAYGKRNVLNGINLEVKEGNLMCAAGGEWIRQVNTAANHLWDGDRGKGRCSVIGEKYTGSFSERTGQIDSIFATAIWRVF